jgi:hypothetical protein
MTVKKRTMPKLFGPTGVRNIGAIYREEQDRGRKAGAVILKIIW